MYRPKLIVVVNNTRKKGELGQMWERPEKKREAERLMESTPLVNEKTRHFRLIDVNVNRATQ